MNDVAEKPKAKPSLATEALSPHICSFCDKTQREVKMLVAREGNFPAICDECITLCIGLMGLGGST